MLSNHQNLKSKTHDTRNNNYTDITLLIMFTIIYRTIPNLFIW